MEKEKKKKLRKVNRDILQAVKGDGLAMGGLDS